MKTISNIPGKLAAAASLVSVCGLVLAPVSSFALGAKTAAATTTTPASSAFCSALSAKTGTIITTLTTRAGKATQAWAQRDQAVAADEQKVDQKVATARQTADTTRAQDLTKLEAKATTDPEKQAVQTYETAVQAAVTTRRAAYDAARQAFNDGINSTVGTRASTVTGQLSSFQDSVNSAINTAQASCANDPANGPAVRLTLQAGLKSARLTFQGERKSDDTVSTQVKQLATIRDAAFKAADQTFQTALSAARQSLEQAFSKTGNGV
jgi:hypothetical protein